LPAAIAAPTPVSALVHSSTLVTAGVYLIIRFNLIFFNYYFIIILLLLGSLTIFISGLGANYEIDLKKTIALSTLSQLGLIMRILSLGFYKLAFFHLLTHALFKALIFLCAGGIIHNFFNIQDIRFIGSLTNLIPLSIFCFNVASLALCGMPFLAGFYSKDIILEILIINNINLVIFFIFFSTGLTVSYSFRLIYFICINKIIIFCLLNLSENNRLIIKSIIILIFISIIGGRVLS
jgi:NADH-ubiquinone oxidoreductase chain 5